MAEQEGDKQRKRLTREQIENRKLEQAKEFGTYVVKGLSLESRALIRNMNEYDSSMLGVKKILGRPGVDQQKALDLVSRGVALENDFKTLTKEMTSFLKAFYNNQRGHDGQEDRSNGKKEVTAAQ